MLKPYADLPANPVSNFNAENALLGAFLMNNDAYLEVCDFIKPEYFYHSLNHEIFEAISCLVDAGKEADAMTAANIIKGKEGMTVDAVAEHLRQMARYAPTSKAMRSYVDVLRESYERRELAQVCDTAVRVCADPDNDGYDKDFLSRHIEAVDKITLLNEENPAETSFAVAQRILERFKHGELPPVCNTGLVDVDAVLNGLREEWLVILAGRPGMGKSLVAGQIASNVAQAGNGVIFISLEMNNDQMGERLAVGFAAQKFGPYNIPPVNDIYKPFVPAEQKERLQEATRLFGDLPIIWERGTGLTMSNIRMRVNRAERVLKAQGAELKLIIIDHMGLIKSAARRSTKYEEASDVSNDLKALAKRYRIPVMALSQLSRAVEQREDKRPVLSDLRESGHIEQDADIVMFAYRDAYYAAKEDTSNMTPDEQMAVAHRADSKTLLLDIAKNRHGAARPVDLWCEVSRMHVSNKAPDFREEQR